MSASDGQPSRHGGGAHSARGTDPTATARLGHPIDLRLACPAVAVWLAAGIGVGLPASATATAAAVCGAVAVVVLVGDRRATRSAGRSGAGPFDARPVLGRSRTRRRPRHRGHGAVVGGAILTLAAAATCLSVVAAGVHARGAGWWGTVLRDGATVQVEGVVATEPAPVRATPDGTEPRVRLRLEVRAAVGRGGTARPRAPVLVLAPAGARAGGWQAVTVGQPVRAVGRLVPTSPGDDVVALLVVRGAPERAGRAPPVARAVTALRTGLLAASAGLAPDAAGLVPGIAVGDTSRVPGDLEAAMRTVSLTHLTAVSGAHVAIILGTLLAATGWLRPGVRAVICCVALAGFVLLVRPEPSVQRAAAMGAVAVLGLLLGRRARPVPALAASVVVLVLLDPWIARSYGFALSVLATAGLVLLAPPWTAALSRRVPSWLAHAVAVPAAAQAVCGPVVVLLDPALALYAVPANLLAAPAVPPATVLGVLATLCGAWWPDAAHGLAAAAGVAAAWIAAVARTMAALPGARIAWPGGAGGAALLAVATLAAAVLWSPRSAALRGTLLRTRARRWRLGVAAATVVALAAVVPLAPRWLVPLLPGGLPRDWVVVACDVGQGTAVLVRSGARSAVMIDVGPPGRAAARCLDHAGVRSLDLVVLSHLHADHVGGLPAVLAGRRVAGALVTPYDEPADARRDVGRVLDSAGVPVLRPSVGPGVASGRAGTLRWDVVAPRRASVQAAVGADGTTVNDQSLAVLVRGPDVHLLALGDLEDAGQRDLARLVRLARDRSAPAAARLDAVDVVVVAHHGSGTQDAGLARLVGAPLAVVSVGADNDYGHPAPSTMELYAQAGGRVLRTDTCGAIVLAGSRRQFDEPRCPQ